MIDKFPTEIIHLKIAPLLFSIGDFMRLSFTCKKLAALRNDSSAIFELLLRAYSNICECNGTPRDLFSCKEDCWWCHIPLLKKLPVEILTHSRNARNLPAYHKELIDHRLYKNDSHFRHHHLIRCPASLTAALIVACQFSHNFPILVEVVYKILLLIRISLSSSVNNKSNFNCADGDNQPSNHPATLIDKLFMSAAKHNDLPIIAAIISTPVFKLDVNVALETASASGSLAVVEYLLKSGADLNFKNNSPFRQACAFHHLPVVQTLIESGADISALGGEALQVAAAQGYTDIVNLILSITTETKLAGINQALFKAVRSGSVGTIPVLLKHGADIDVLGAHSAENIQMLKESFLSNSLEIPLMLLSHRPPIAINFDIAKLLFQKCEAPKTPSRLQLDLLWQLLNQPESAMYSPNQVLPWASLVGDVKLIKILLSVGVKVDQVSVLNATRTGNLNILRKLAQHGGDLCGNDYEIWWEAVNLRHVDLLEFFLDWMVEKHRDKSKWPTISDPFYLHVVAGGHVQTIRGLSAVRKEQARTSVCWLPLESVKLAAANGHTAVLDIIIANMREIITSNQKGSPENKRYDQWRKELLEVVERSLLSAKKNGHVSVAEHLLQFQQLILA